MIPETLESFALLFEYPTAEYQQLIQTCCLTVGEALEVSGRDEVNGLLLNFQKANDGRTREELEELYTRTFDLNPVCSLDLGWHLYAENYDRGAFLVRMRELLRRHGIPETNELPDHLPSVLKLLARMPKDEGGVLVREFVLPAVKKMTEGFAKSDNPFALLVKAVGVILREMYHQESGVINHG